MFMFIVYYLCSLFKSAAIFIHLILTGNCESFKPHDYSDILIINISGSRLIVVSKNVLSSTIYNNQMNFASHF